MSATRGMHAATRALGLPAGARVAMLHVDDVGMCHGANAAFLELMRGGLVDSGSVMVPCPWFPEIAAAAGKDPAVDLGVHLTLTSEWVGYRWRALSTCSRASGLVDDDGFLPRRCRMLRPLIVAEAAEIEMRAQIDRALAAGIDVTHLDTHMGAALVPELLAITLRLGEEYRLPVMVPRDIESYLGRLDLGCVDVGLYGAATGALERAGVPVVDQFRMTPGVASTEASAAYRTLIRTLPQGLSFVALHCNVSGDIEAIVPSRAHWRIDEHRLFLSGEPQRWMAEEGIERVGYRALRDFYRRAAFS